MGRKPYPDAPCVVCGKIVHPYAKGMCRSCYCRFKHYGATYPPRPATIPTGTVRNGWERVSFKGGVYTYRCVRCGEAFEKKNREWPEFTHRCTWRFSPQNKAQRAVVDVFVKSRYGLDMTYADIAKAFGISRPYVSNLLIAARMDAEAEDADDD